MSKEYNKGLQYQKSKFSVGMYSKRYAEGYRRIYQKENKIYYFLMYGVFLLMGLLVILMLCSCHLSFNYKQRKQNEKEWDKFRDKFKQEERYKDWYE